MYGCLQAAKILQTLIDAEALLFLEKNFTEMFNRWAPKMTATRHTVLHRGHEPLTPALAANHQMG